MYWSWRSTPTPRHRVTFRTGSLSESQRLSFHKKPPGMPGMPDRACHRPRKACAGTGSRSRPGRKFTELTVQDASRPGLVSIFVAQGLRKSSALFLDLSATGPCTLCCPVVRRVVHSAPCLEPGKWHCRCTSSDSDCFSLPLTSEVAVHVTVPSRDRVCH